MKLDSWYHLCLKIFFLQLNVYKIYKKGRTVMLHRVAQHQMTPDILRMGPVIKWIRAAVDS